MNLGLQNKIAIVAAASQGLGRAAARQLALEGATVVICSRREEAITQAAQELREESGSVVLPVKADVTKPQDISHLVSEAEQRFGTVHILVNNAGLIRRDDAIDFSEKDWDDVMNLNIKSVFFMSQAAAKHFIAQGNGGKIINIASMLSFQGGIRVPSYTASKSGVMGVTRLMANEWAKHNINVNAIAPGYMATNNTQ